MKKSFAYPIIFMAILTAVFTFTLAYLNYSTAETIAFNEETELRSKILYVFDIDYDSENPDDIENIFNEKIKVKDIEGMEDKKLYEYYEDGELVGYAFPSAGSGLWGTIEAYIGINKDLNEILGIEFIAQEETPGLGGRISEDFFKDQFRGINLEGRNVDNYIVYTPANDGNVDAIAGATQTSQAVSDFMNKDIDSFIKEGGVINE